MSDKKETRALSSSYHSSLITHHFLRNYHLQSAGADAVVERRREHRDLAVGGDGDALGAARLDPDFSRAERVEVVCLAQAAEERAEGEAQQTQAPGAVRHVEAQASGVQARARAQLEILHPVLVVADEDEGRLAGYLTPVRVEPHAHEGVAPQHGQRRAQERGPFAAPLALLQSLA